MPIPVATSPFTTKTLENSRTKQLEFFDTVVASDRDIICLTETWLNDSCYNHNLFLSGYTVYRSDRVSTCKARGGGALIAFTANLVSCRRRYDLEHCSECVWVEFPATIGPNLLIGNHYFPPDVRPQAIADYFHLLENTLDTNNYRVILLGDFNASGFSWARGSSLPNCHYYSKLKDDAIYTSTTLLGLCQLVEAADNCNLLDLVFANFSDLMPVLADSDWSTPILITLL
jgi:hypothetical protein